MTIQRLVSRVVLFGGAILLGACGTQPETMPEINLIPKPISIQEGAGSFKLKSGMTVAADSGLRTEAAYLAEALRNSSGLQLEEARAGKSGNINLRLGLDDPNPEAYMLTVDPEGIAIQGASPRGWRWGSPRCGSWFRWTLGTAGSRTSR